MEDTLIEYNTAILAKEKGFCEITHHVYYYPEYTESHYIRPQNWNKQSHPVAAPSQQILAKWLREKHGLYIDIRTNCISKGKYFFYIMQNLSPYHTLHHDTKYFDTFEQAYEKGLQEALKLIK